MAKKYSVNVENDEVVSVEVDGISYATPEEIADADDRQQIERLIAKMSADGEDDFGAGLDKEFAADLQEMRRDSARFPKLISGIFLLIALITLTIAVVSALSSARSMAREVSAPGQVVALVERSSRDSETGEVTVYSYPKVEFQPEGLPQRTVQLSEGAFPPAYSVGDRVIILYDPQQPNNARIQSFSSNLLLWILPGITGVVGIAFSIAALVVFKMMRPAKPVSQTDL